MDLIRRSAKSAAARAVDYHPDAWITIVAGKGVDALLLDAVRLALLEDFGTRCRVAEWTLSTATAYNPRRGQYAAETLLRQLDPGEHERMLALVDVDVYVPPFAYVLGLAHADRQRALVALPRLHRPEDEAGFHARVVNEAVHQLSRTYWYDPYAYLSSVRTLIESTLH